jgi:hypothetical protein
MNGIVPWKKTTNDLLIVAPDSKNFYIFFHLSNYCSIMKPKKIIGINSPTSN